jgi:hypothetical protein
VEALQPEVEALQPETQVTEDASTQTPQDSSLPSFDPAGVTEVDTDELTPEVREKLIAQGFQIVDLEDDPAPATDPVVDDTVKSDEQVETGGLTAAQLEKIALGEYLQEVVAKDPLSLVRDMIANGLIDPTTLGEVYTPPPAVEFDPATYEPTSELERALLPQWEFIQNAPKIIAEQVAARDADIVTTYSVASRNEILVEAIAEMLGLEVPEFNLEEIQHQFHSSTDPNIRLGDVIKNVYGKKVKKSIDIAKQRTKPRPDTPRSTPGVKGGIPEIKTIEDARRAAVLTLARMKG